MQFHTNGWTSAAAAVAAADAAAAASQQRKKRQQQMVRWETRGRRQMKVQITGWTHSKILYP